jgi:hypothetical protein
LNIITSIPLVSAPSRVESNDLKELLEVSKEYITAIRLKTAIAEAGENPVRGLELAAYFTHCRLQPGHLLLALKTAMATAFKNKVSIPYFIHSFILYVVYIYIYCYYYYYYSYFYCISIV